MQILYMCVLVPWSPEFGGVWRMCVPNWGIKGVLAWERT